MPRRKVNQIAPKAKDGFIRPEAEVLSERSLVPARNLISPAPNQFSHKVSRPADYCYSAQQATPDGQFPVGTKVVLLMYDNEDFCWVADQQGLYVSLPYDCLKKL